MSDAISRLMVCLVLLGFLASTTMNMYGDMQQLKSDNQTLTGETTQLRSSYEAVVQERDILKAEKAELSTKLDAIQKVYVLENQARVKAESDAATYKNMMTSMVNNPQTLSPSICTQMEQQAIESNKVLFSDFIPLGAGSLVTLAIAIFIGIMIDYHRRRRS